MDRKEIEFNPPLCIDGHPVVVLDFQSLWDRRHVFKHALNSRQQWEVYYGSINLIALRNQLALLGCKGYRGDGEDETNMHGPSCPNFVQCEQILGDLYPTYRNLIMEAIRLGAYEKAPRHTHNQGRTQTSSGQVQWRRPTNYFLSDRGVLAETYEDKRANQICFKTAYRVVPQGRKPPGTRWQESHFVRAAQEDVCIGRKRSMVQEYHNRERWCGKR
jgi:hypothetical protein